MRNSCEGRLSEAYDFLSESSLFRSGRNETRFFLTWMRSRILADQPLEFVAHWGIGRRSSTGSPERRAIAFQKSWARILEGIVGIEVKIHYLLADTHARLNRIPEDTISAYTKDARHFLQDEGYTVESLSSLMAHQVIIDCRSAVIEVDEALWNSLPRARTHELERLARSHSAPDFGRSLAMEYYASNLLESAVIGSVFPSRSFLTYQPHQMDLLLPALPRLHVYVYTNKGVKRPWFSSEV